MVPEQGVKQKNSIRDKSEIKRSNHNIQDEKQKRKKLLIIWGYEIQKGPSRNMEGRTVTMH